MKKTYADQCLELASKSTPGIWTKGLSTEWNDDLSDEVVVKNKFKTIGPISYAGCGSHRLSCPDDDAEFIINARTDVVELANRLRRSLEWLKVIEAVYGRNYPHLSATIKDLEKPLRDE